MASKMKQTMDINEQLKIAYANQEDTGEKDYKHLINADPDIIDDPLATDEMPSMKVSYQDSANKPELKQDPVDNQEPVTANKEAYTPTAPAPVEQKQTIQTQPQPEVQTQPKYKPNIDQQANRQLIADSTVNTNTISKIINIYDLYKTYDGRTQSTVRKFVKVESDEIEKVIYGVLTVNEADLYSLIDLVELKLEDGTSRAFSLMSLSDNRLAKVSELLMLFNPEYTEHKIDNRIQFCRELEAGIETLKEESLKYLSPVKDLLVIAKDE